MEQHTQKQLAAEMPPKPKQKQKSDPISQLNLQVDRNNREDYQQVMRILAQVLAYPSVDLAELHMEANRLGADDVDGGGGLGLGLGEDREKRERCQCCRFVRQIQTVPLCTALKAITNLGISTYLYFRTIKNLIYLLLVLILLYSIFALVTNILASNQYRLYLSSDSPNLYSTLTYLTISLCSKQLNHTDQNRLYYLIQCWLGLGVIVIWVGLELGLVWAEMKRELDVDRRNVSASDFTVMVAGVPKDVGVGELQGSFDAYRMKIMDHHQDKEELKIAKINVGRPFYLNKQDFDDEELSSLQTQRSQLMNTFANWILQRQQHPQFSTTQEHRNEAYNTLQLLTQNQQKKYNEVNQKICKKIRQQTQQELTTIFITFQTDSAMRIVSTLNDSSLTSKIRYYLNCCRGKKKFVFYRGENQYRVEVERAPQPEDILWNNLAVPFRQLLKRKLITYSATFILLAISFFIVYGLSQVQKNSGSNQLISLLISISIALINILLTFVIRYLSIYERDYTRTKYESSFAMKSIFAALINSIAIPILVDYYIKGDFYGRDGLASDVFMLGLANSFVSPLIKLLGLTYLINRANKHLSALPANRLQSNQVQLNKNFEYEQFELGQEYIYLVSLFLFTCFYISLQPIIGFFAVCGMLMMHWIQKYCIFRRMKRPVPGTNLVHVAMEQIVLLGGILYSIGSLTWANFVADGQPRAALLPNLIALGFGVLMFLLPYRAIIAQLTKESKHPTMKYSSHRSSLPSEYDRLNPVTSAQAILEHRMLFSKSIQKLPPATEGANKLPMDIMRSLLHNMFIKEDRLHLMMTESRDAYETDNEKDKEVGFLNSIIRMNSQNQLISKKSLL